VLLPLLGGANLTVEEADFPEATPGSSGQNCQICKLFRDDCPEEQLRGCDPQVAGVCRLLRAIGTATTKEASPDLDGVNCARLLKVTKAERL
jgi:hypothetical protein